MDKKDFFLSLFFPKRCRFCEKVIDYRETVCEECKKNIPSITEDVCNKCGCEKFSCSCGKKATYYMSIYAPYYYSGAPREAVKRLKFHNGKHLADSLADDMADCFNKRYKELEFDFCTFVPAHKSTIKKRGYNQAKLLCKSLSEKTGIPFADLLKKDFKTPSQHTLNEATRKGNLLGAISLRPKMKESIRGARILLCDDIKTTGSTLDECAKTLLINGAEEVRCITLCVTKNDKK